MVGRGGGKNVGSRSGVRMAGLANNRRTLNVSQTRSNHDLANQRVMSLNMINEQVGSSEGANEAPWNNSHHVQVDHLNTLSGHFDHESEGFVSPNDGTDAQLGKRKRMNKLAGRVDMVLGAQVILDPPSVRDEGAIAQRIPVQRQEPHGGLTNTTISNNRENGEATSKAKRKGDRGKYKSYVVDMKVKGKKSKLKISIPDEIDRAIGENARHLVNECGFLVRRSAPLNVRNWSEAFALAGDAMWKEIEGKFEIKEGSSYLKMQAFVIDTMQRLYRLWKARLHTYYKSKDCGTTDEERLTKPPPDLPQEEWAHCVKRFSSPEFKEQQNGGVKSTADVIWLAEHTHKNDKGELEWADRGRSKHIYEKLKAVVATHGDLKTQEEILLEVLEPRYGYFRGKGTSLRGLSK